MDTPGFTVRSARSNVANAEAVVYQQEMSLTRMLLAGQTSDAQEALLAETNETLRTLRHRLVVVEQKYPAE